MAIQHLEEHLWSLHLDGLLGVVPALVAMADHLEEQVHWVLMQTEAKL